MRNMIIILVAVLSLSLFGLVRTKLYVQSLNVDIKNMAEQKYRLRDQIQVLRAEWAYLNNIDRLESLSDQHLIGLTKVSSEQLKTFADSESRVIQVKYSKTSPTAKTNWKYKSRDAILKVRVSPSH